MIDEEIAVSTDRDEVDAVIRDLHSIKKLYVDPAHHHTRARVDVACTVMQVLLDERKSTRIKALQEAADIALNHQTIGNDLMDTELGQNAACKNIYDAVMGLIHKST